MESANVQVLRHLQELFAHRDFNAYMKLLAPDIEWHVARDDPDTTVHRGPDAVRSYLEHWLEMFSDLQFHMGETRDAGDRVFTVLHMRGHGTGSGAPFEMGVAFVFTLRDGRVTKVEEFFDRNEALRAAGLDQASTK